MSALSATQLLIALRRGFHWPLPPARMVLDSRSATGVYWKSYNARLLFLPSSAAARLVGTIAVHSLAIALYASIASEEVESIILK